MAALKLGRAQENMFSHEQNLKCTERWVEKLVGQGKLPASALEALKQRDIPTTTVNSKPMAEMVPQYVKGPIPGECSRQWLCILHGAEPAYHSCMSYPLDACPLLLRLCRMVLLQLHEEPSIICTT